MSYGMNDQKRPLTEQDNLTQTLGCRHSSPDICKFNGNSTSCAFGRKDGLCLSPPQSWSKIFRSLGGDEEK
jgi:hypothetical protein